MNKSAVIISTAIIGLFSFGIAQECANNSKNAKSLIQDGSALSINKDSITMSRRIELIKQLDSILQIDQKDRSTIMSVRKEFGSKSDTIKKLMKIMTYNDSINLIKVTKILDQYGWLGSNVVGYNGNTALFLVIQHSNKNIMEKYFPMMKDAVKKGNAEPELFALLVDRIEMLNGRPQIYGSQMQIIDGKRVLYKIIDEKNVNKRRAEVGLGSLEEYLKLANVEYKTPDK
jgi:hypothetical protein